LKTPTLNIHQPPGANSMSQTFDFKQPTGRKPALATDVDRGPLESKVGLFDGFGLNRRDSKRAVAALDVLNDAKTSAITNVGLTAIALGEAQMRQTLVVNAMATVGSLTMQVNNQTAAVVGGLSSGMTAETLSHLKNRHANGQIVDEYHRAGGVSTEEAEQIKGLLHTVAHDDINRAVRRMNKSKDAVEALAAHAVDGIERTKDRLQ
jgi:hypothetical protein